MGGIAGIVAFKGNPKPAIEDMLEAIVHRGPGHVERYHEVPVQFGGRSLQLESGEKGLITSQKDGSVIGVFSGVLSNAAAPAGSCKSRAIDPTRCSSEFVTHLYAELGLDFIDAIEGQFALAIFDRKKDITILARDSLGICPLFYAVTDNALVFASEIKALAKSGEVTLRPSVRGLYEGFVYWSTSGGRTVFENIYQVPPGSCVILGRDKQISFHRFSSSINIAPTAVAEDIATVKALIHTTLSQSLADSLAGKGKKGIYLSGGLDSTIILRLADQLGYPDMPVFSLGFVDSKIDESAYQALALKGHAGEHHRVMVRGEDIIAFLPRVIRHCEVPLFKLGPVPMFMLSNLARQAGVQYVLSGEGADELFYGYDLFKETQYRLNLAKDPTSRRFAQDIEHIVPPQYRNKPSILAMYREFFFRYLDGPEDALFCMRPRIEASSAIFKYFTPDNQSIIDQGEIDALVASEFRPSPSALRQCQDVQMQILLAGYLLAAQGDRVLMANSVEGRFPFLNQRLLELSMSIPDSLKLAGYQEKFILKQTFADIVPPPILERQKYQYSTPGAEIFLRCQDAIASYLTKETFETFGIFDYKPVLPLIQGLGRGRRDYHQIITEEMILTYIVTTHMLLGLAERGLA